MNPFEQVLEIQNTSLALEAKKLGASRAATSVIFYSRLADKRATFPFLLSVFMSQKQLLLETTPHLSQRKHTLTHTPVYVYISICEKGATDIFVTLGKREMTSSSHS